MIFALHSGHVMHNSGTQVIDVNINSMNICHIVLIYTNIVKKKKKVNLNNCNSLKLSYAGKQYNTIIMHKLIINCFIK